MLIVKTKGSSDREKRMSIRGRAVLLMALASAAASADDAAMETSGLPPEIEAAAASYQNCVNAVMSTMQPAALKRQQMAERCAGEREMMIESFPEPLRPLIATNTDRRIAAVIDALDQIENAVVESAADVQEIAEDLAALEKQKSGQD